MDNSKPLMLVRLIAFSLVLLVITASSNSSEAIATEVKCKKTDAVPANPIYRGLKNISIHVRVTPASYLKAIECHGREDQCADEHGALYKLKTPPEGWREKYLTTLKSEYDAFPEVLHPQALSKLLAKSVKDKFTGYSTATEDCQPPIAIVLDEKSFHAFEALDEQGQSDKGTLTIFVQIRIVDNFHPRIALLSTNFYRPGAALRSQLIENDTLILPLVEGDLQETVKKWADNFIRIWAKQ